MVTSDNHDGGEKVNEAKTNTGTVFLSRRGVLASLVGSGLLYAPIGSASARFGSRESESAFSTSVPTRTVQTSIPGVGIEFKRCKVAFITGASNVGTLAVYYADKMGERRAVYAINPTNPQKNDSLVVNYDDEEDRAQIVREGPGALVCITAEADSSRMVKTNPTTDCVPDGFNTTPSASFTVSENPTVGEPVTFTSTATDPDDPERLYYHWDIDENNTFDASGRTVTTTYTEAGEVTVRHRVTDDCGASDTATKPITIESPYPTKQVARLVPDSPDRTTVIGFSRSVCIDGDTAVVGAPGEDTEVGRSTGSVYVFIHDGTSWSRQAKLLPDIDGKGFGASVSIEGDTAVVGSGSGLVYVFVRDETSWTQQAKLHGDADANRSDSFGLAVSLNDDTVVVGAPREDTETGERTGAAYIFSRDGESWTRQAKLLPDDPDSQQFGAAVSLDANTAVVGAPQEDRLQEETAFINEGAAYVFTRDGTSWTIQSKLVLNIGDAQKIGYAHFGYSVSIDSDSIVVGMFYSASFMPKFAGFAYVYTRDGASWTRQTKLLSDVSDRSINDRFGRAVSIDGDTIVVGSPISDLVPDHIRQEIGERAYVFTRDGNTWTRQAELKSKTDSPYEDFGMSVSLSGGTALIGATDGQGVAYVFE